MLDEVEKAHPDVFNILLQVLDDGRLTDSQGRTVDFKNTVIIMTSNIGSDVIHEKQESEYDEIKALLMDRLTQHFRPEFINRLDDTVVFHGLRQEHVAEIAKIQIDVLTKRLLQQNLHLNISEEALALISTQGFDAVYGARPLKRAIQNLLENPLSEKILSGAFNSNDEIDVTVKDDRFEFSH